jgi:beta-galactosidase
MICSNCQRLELFIDGKHLGTLHPDKERFPHLPYPPSFVSFDGVDGGKNPVLRIDGYLGNQKIISRSFSSDRAQDRLSVLADDAEIEADGSDATRVEFRAVDRFGAPRPYVKGDISLTIGGPAVLLGDNPFAFEDAGGAGAVWIRSRPGEAGRITVQLRHPVLGSARVVIQARHNSSQKL